MKHLQKLPMSIFIILGALLISCHDEVKETEPATPTLKEEYLTAGEKEIVLGKKIENPYAVATMQKAYENLMNSESKNSNVSKKVGESVAIVTNHHYVRFWCVSQEDRDKLTALDIKFSDFPLDQEIEETGNFFAEEDITAENYEGSWIYTSLLADFDYESLGLRYEILEDLFLFEEAQGEDIEEDDSVLAKASDSEIAFYEALEKEAFRITGNLEKEMAKNKSNIQERCWFFCSGRTQPKGTLKVYNTETRSTDPVVGVKVRTYRWFVWGYGYTNSNGYYVINKKYRGNPWYSIDFDNPSNKIKIYSTWLSLSDATYRAWTQSKSGYDKTFYTNSYGWRFSTVNNAVVKYRKYCDQYGITKPSAKMRINVTNGTGSASAPMLQKTWGFIGYNSHASVSNFFANLGFGVINTASYFFKWVLPDIWIQANSSNGTAKVFSTTFHEMAHASHFEKVGGSYWAKYISYIITYGSYGDGTGRNAGLCALGEAWGYHIGNFLTIQEFGNNNSELTSGAFENFDPIQRPNDIAKSRYTDANGNLNSTGWAGWMPSGLINDIIDTNSDLVRTGFRDNVSGYTLQNIYNALDRDVASPQAFRDRLLQENGNRDETDLRNLFEAYYYN